MNIDRLVEQIKTYVKQKYNCHTIILYGSYHTGDYSKESDIDIICFSDHTEDKNDVELFNGKQLDVWVYHSDQMDHAETFLRVHKGKVLLDDKGMAESFLSKIETVWNEGPKKLSEEEKDFLKEWLNKMYVRSNKNDLEGNYRFYWMLKDSLEIYFELKGLWYLGPKKSFKWLQENDPLAYSLYKNALEKNADAKEVESLLQYLKEI